MVGLSRRDARREGALEPIASPDDVSQSVWRVSFRPRGVLDVPGRGPGMHGRSSDVRDALSVCDTWLSVPRLVTSRCFQSTETE